MTDVAFDAMLAHLQAPAQRRAQRNGTLAVTLFNSCIVANGVGCTTLAELAAITACRAKG